MDYKCSEVYLFIMILVVIYIFKITYYGSKKEHMADTVTPASLSNEAIQNIASVYKDKDMKVTKITAGQVFANGGGNNKWGGTHFPWDDGMNYIRGNTEIRGDTLTVAAKLNAGSDATVAGDLRVNGLLTAEKISYGDDKFIFIKYGDGAHQMGVWDNKANTVSPLTIHNANLVNGAVANNMTITGSLSEYAILPNKDYNGSDLQKITANREQCLSACSTNANCDAVTHAGSDCYMKTIPRDYNMHTTYAYNKTTGKIDSIPLYKNIDGKLLNKAIAGGGVSGSGTYVGDCLNNLISGTADLITQSRGGNCFYYKLPDMAGATTYLKKK
jgi:hypothetical protein